MITWPEGLPTKAKEVPSPHEVRLAPLDTNPVCLGVKNVFLYRSITKITWKTFCVGLYFLWINMVFMKVYARHCFIKVLLSLKSSKKNSGLTYFKSPLIHLKAMFHFYIPRKHQKTRDFYEIWGLRQISEWSGNFRFVKIWYCEIYLKADILIIPY